MCGRYLTPEQAALERAWGLIVPADFSQSFNIAPSQLAPVVRTDDSGRLDMSMLTWGFQPSWAERSWINARSETTFTTRAFASAAQKRRCLIPTMGWYEWQEGEAPRQPYVFHLEGFKPFAFAGIWTGRETDEGWQRSFAILTTEAAGPLSTIHHRKPVVVAEENYDQWLARDTTIESAKKIMVSDLGHITTYPVSVYVNKPVNNDAACIRPADETTTKPA